jgi:putative glycosyltransferase (TIGR04348 family)
VQSLLIRIICPAPRGARNGNRVTALRWAAALRKLGHHVVVGERYAGGETDLLIALHATKSHDSIVAFRAAEPQAPLVVALTGTDLYQDFPIDPRTRTSVELASRLVALQPEALSALPEAYRHKARVIFQSARPPPRSRRPGPSPVACVLANLRSVKDPLCAARAARLLPAESRLTIAHAGAVIEPELGAEAEQEAGKNPRYRWLGALPRARALELLAGSDLLVLTSHAEGGANVVTEALACGVPVLSSRIAGSVGLLGEDYPGYFTAGRPTELAALLLRFETDEAFRAALMNRCRTLAGLADPAAELSSWQALVRELTEHCDDSVGMANGGQGTNMTEPRLTTLVQGGG